MDAFAHRHAGQVKAIQAAANTVAKIRLCQLVPTEGLEPPVNDLDKA
jgi:hypothetical protein